jgi:hypothetical protein
MPGKIFSREEIEYIKSNYPDKRSDEIADILNCSLSSVYQIAHKFGIYKSKEFLTSDESGRLNKRLAIVGKKYRFKKGHIPANKGKKMPEEIRKKVTHTFFTKGHEPANTKANGTITVRRDSKDNRYKWIKISYKNWKMLQVLNWENKYGPVPKGKILVCKDGNQLNCEPENWILADRALHLDRNAGRSALTDKYIVSKLSPRDKDLQEIMAGSTELIELKRNQLKLKREINERN